jgi:hypothetical protein
VDTPAVGGLTMLTASYLFGENNFHGMLHGKKKLG